MTPDIGQAKAVQPRSYEGTSPLAPRTSHRFRQEAI